MYIFIQFINVGHLDQLLLMWVTLISWTNESTYFSYSWLGGARGGA